MRQLGADFIRSPGSEVLQQTMLQTSPAPALASHHRLRSGSTAGIVAAPSPWVPLDVWAQRLSEIAAGTFS